MTRPTRRADDGASLLIVLAFMMFIGLIAGAVASYGSSSLTSTRATKYRADLSLDTDGALKTAVNQIRNSAYDNDSPTDACDLNGATAGATLTYPASAANTGQNLTVTCTGGLGTGVDGGLVPINASNRPGSAVLTLGTDPAERGLDVQAAGGGSALRIKGQVYVNSNAAVGSNGSVIVQNAQFHARTGCTGSIVSTPAKNCADTGTGPQWEDPNYDAPDTSTLTLQKPPVTSCASAGQTITLNPGYYDDVDLLNNLTEPPQCAGKTLWFTPGTYFFDFHNGEGAPLSNAAPEWTVKRDVKIVAGTRSSAWTDLNSSPAIPGACVSPLTTVDNHGVQFVFGEESHIKMDAGQMEICGDYSATRPALSVYGMKSGTDTTHANKTALGTASSTPTGTKAFSTSSAAYAIDGTVATAAIDPTGSGNPPDTAGITLDGFVPTDAIPAGSLLSAVTVDVAHRDVGASTDFASNGLSLDVTPKRTGAASIWSTSFNATPSTNPNSPMVATTYSGATTAALLTALQNEVHDHGLSTGLKITFKAKVANNKKAISHLDGIRLTLTWKPPAVRAQSGCVKEVPARTNYNGTGGCYLIQVDGQDTIAYFQGTTYAPGAAIYIKLNNVSEQVFKSGLIVRAIGVFVTGSFQFPEPVFEIPSDSFGPGPTDVYFRAYNCPERSTCLTDPEVANGNWQLAGTARVSYDDAIPGVPVPGSREVTVKSWTVHR